jgi:Flp pilus assembly protein TadG
LIADKTSEATMEHLNDGVAHMFRRLRKCNRGVAALEFALVATPLMVITFGFISISLAIYTMTAMQNAAQYAAFMVATGQAKSISTGPLSSSNTTATTTCSGSLPSTEAEYYACKGLPAWASFTVTTTENCATPSVSVNLSVKASAAGISDIFGIFSNNSLSSNAVAMKEGACP